MPRASPPRLIRLRAAAVAAAAEALAGGLSALANAWAGKTLLANAAIHRAQPAVPRRTKSFERLVVKADKSRGFSHTLALRHHCIGGEALVGPAQGDALHNDLVVGNTCMLAHHRRLHDALAVDDGA